MITHPAPQTVAIFGGSFDPPHVAHVLAVAAVLSTQPVDAVWIMPVDRHPLAKQPISWRARLALCHAAFSLFGERAVVREDEHTLGGAGRTLDLLQHLAARHPETRFRLVVGSDQLTNRHRWHRFDAVEAMAPLIVLGRPGHPVPAPYQAAVTLPDLSSTAARAALAAGELPSYLPHAVRHRILAEGLYGHAPAAHAPEGAFAALEPEG